MTMRLATYTDFEPNTCITCGCQFAMTAEMNRERIADGNWFYCPAGHRQQYSDPLVKRLERQLTQERAAHDQTKAARATAEAEAARLKKRASLGKCPCCAGQFRNLRNHMQRKHPDFAPLVKAKK